MSFHHAKLSFLFLFASLPCACSRADEGLTNVENPFYAAELGDFESLKLKLKNDPDLVKTTNERGSTLLHYAAHGDQPEIVRYLVKRGADVNALDYSRKTPLHYAAERGRSFEAAKVLIELGADVNARPEWPELATKRPDGSLESMVYGGSVLEHAASSGDYRLLELLIKKGAKIEVEKSPIGSALHYACFRNDYSNDPKDPETAGNRKVIALLTKHLDINVKNKLNATPLHYAARFGAVETVKYLVSNYENLDLNPIAGGTPLHLAVDPDGLGGPAKDRAEVIKILIKAGADVNRVSKQLTPQQLAEKIGNKTIIEAFKTE